MSRLASDPTGVSIQRRWQRKQRAAGRCTKCRKKRVTSQFCTAHAAYQAGLMRKKRLRLAYLRVVASRGLA
jgi:hypothetical protein